MNKQERDTLTSILILITLIIFGILFYKTMSRGENIFLTPKIIASFSEKELSVDEESELQEKTSEALQASFYNIPIDSLLEITVQNNLEEKSLQQLKKNNGNWQLSKKEEIELDDEKVFNVLRNLSNPIVKTKIDGNKNRDKEFGLFTPSFVITLKTIDAEVFVIELGSIVPSGYDCYAKKQGTTEYFIIDGELYLTANQNFLTLQYDNPVFFPLQREIKKIEIVHKNSQGLEIEVDENSRAWIKSGYLAKSQPISQSREIFETGLTPFETLYEKIKNLENCKIVETNYTLTHSNMDQYGLSTPVLKLSIAGVRGKPYKLTYVFGASNEKTETTFFKTSNSDNLYEIESRFVEGLLLRDLFKIVDKKLFDNAESLKLEVNCDDEKKLLELTRTGVLTDGVLTEAFDYIASLTVDQELPNGIVLDSKIAPTIRITTSPANSTILIKPYDFVFFVAQVESGNEFLIHKKKINKLLEMLENL